MDSVVDLATGPTGKRINTLLGRLERLSQDKEGLERAIDLLKQVERMDDKGALTRLDALLRDLKPLVTGKGAKGVLSRLDKLDQVLDQFLKD